MEELLLFQYVSCIWNVIIGDCKISPPVTNESNSLDITITPYLKMFIRSSGGSRIILRGLFPPIDNFSLSSQYILQMLRKFS